MYQPHEIDTRSISIDVDGKLWGSRARRLGEILASAWDRGFDRVILDLTRCPSIDTLGEYALQRALELGFELYLVTGPAFRLYDYIPVTHANLDRTRTFTTREEALRALQTEDSGRLALV